jgi:hypothetical protein
MQQYDVFTLDQSAIDELKLENVQSGQQYRITQPVNGVEVRASRVGADNKPQKGRPRSFPVALVARLLGQPVPTPAAPAPAAEETEEAAETTVAACPVLSAEEREEAAARNKATVARVTGGDTPTTLDW